MKLLSCLLLVAIFSCINSQNYLPGSNDFIGCGFDALKGVGYLLPLFKFHDSENQYWIAPGTNGTVNYTIPDEISFVQRFVSNETIVENIYTSYDSYMTEYESHFTFSAGLSIGSFGLSFQYSKELKDIYQKLSTNSNAQGFSKHWIETYQLEMFPPQFLTLHPIFEQVIKQLPPTISSPADKAKYQQVIDYYGTHFPSFASFGGYVHMFNFVLQAYLQTHSESYVEEQMSLTFHYNLYNLSAGGFSNRSEIHIDQSFLMNSETDIYFSGGATEYQSNDTLTDWVKSIPANSEYLNVTLHPIAELIADPTTQNTFINFVSQYISQGNHKLNRRLIKKNIPNTFTPLFGLDYMQRGIDATTLEPTLPIFEFTYSDNNTFSIPFAPNYQDMIVPDQVYPAIWTETFQFNFTVDIQDSWNLQAYYEHESSHSSWFGLSSSSKKVIKTFQHQYQQDQYLSMSKLQFSYYTLTMPDLPPPQFTTVFQEAYDSLPGVYDASTQAQYYQFFSYFGCGYFDFIKMGAEMEVDQWYNKCLSSTHSTEWIEQQSSWSFMGLIGSGHGTSYSYQSQSELYTGLTQAEVMLNGGDLTKTYNANQYLDWMNSVAETGTFVPVSYNIQPIHQLLPDGQKKQNIINAMNDYMEESQDKLTNLVNNMKQYDPNVIPNHC